MRTNLAAPFAALLLVASAASQHDESRTVPAATFVLEVGSHEVPDLIDRAAAHLDYNILHSANELQGAGQIRITREIEVDSKGCWELLGSLLYHKGLAIIALDPNKGLYEVISMQGPRSREIMGGAPLVPSTEIEKYANMKATPIMTSVALKNINATVANNALRPFFASTGAPGSTGGVTLGNVGNNSDMLLVGFGPQVVAACRLLKLVDTGGDGGKSQVRVVRLEHAPAVEIVARVEDTLGMRAMQASSQNGMPVSSAIRAVAHPELNAVILSGTEVQVRDALDLIATLDGPAVAPSRISEDLEKRLRQLEERMQKIEQALRKAK